MEKVYFYPSENFQPKTKNVLNKIRRELLLVFPSAEAYDMGSTSIPGLLTKGDLDINLRVGKKDYKRAISYMSKSFDRSQLENWNDGFASFASKGDIEGIPVGIQITVKGHEEDKFFKQLELLKSDPSLIKKYNDIKKEYNGREMDDYRKAKWKFIEDNLENK